ncbi:MAG: short-chain dehydrogenase [Aerococcus sp.]|nr:short-chain dehydrogenase [Aerococcus sp.]
MGKISSDMHNPPYFDLEWQGVENLVHLDAGMMDKRYYYSKLCNLYFTHKLNRQLQARGRSLTVSALNPGFMGDTNLAGGNMTPECIAEVKRTVPDRFGDLNASAQAATEILTKDVFISSDAKYYDRSIHVANSSTLSYSVENARELWDESMKLVGMEE